MEFTLQTPHPNPLPLLQIAESVCETEFFHCLGTLCVMDYSLPGSSVHGILQARILKWVAVPFSRGSSRPRTEPRSSTLQEDALPSELPGKPKNTGVGRLSLLQWILLTQELNWSLLQCRQIIYPLSYQGSP